MWSFLSVCLCLWVFEHFQNLFIADDLAQWIKRSTFYSNFNQIKQRKKLTTNLTHTRTHTQVFVTQKRRKKTSNHESTFRIWTVLKSIICIWIPGIWNRYANSPKPFSRNTQKSICLSIMLASWHHHTTSPKMALKVNLLSIIWDTSYWRICLCHSSERLAPKIYIHAWSMCHRAQILWATSIWTTSMARKYSYRFFLFLCLTCSFDDHWLTWHLIKFCFWFVCKTHSKDYYPPDAYNQSKLAQVLFTRHLQLQINQDEDCHVQIQAVHPGVVDTDLFQYSSLSYISWFKKLFFKVCCPPKIRTQNIFWTMFEYMMNFQTFETKLQFYTQSYSPTEYGGGCTNDSLCSHLTTCRRQRWILSK